MHIEHKELKLCRQQPFLTQVPSLPEVRVHMWKAAAERLHYTGKGAAAMTASAIACSLHGSHATKCTG